jgi:hypothetical protein
MNPIMVSPNHRIHGYHTTVACFYLERIANRIGFRIILALSRSRRSKPWHYVKFLIRHKILMTNQRTAPSARWASSDLGLGLGIN